MSGGIDFTPDQVTTALMALAVAGGNCAAVSEELIDGEFEVSASTLRRWKNDTHAERYHELEVRYGKELEQITIERLRRNADRAAEIEADLLERATSASHDQVPQMLRAVADSKSKSVDKLLAMTGRAPEERRGPDMVETLRGLAAKGLVRINVNLDANQAVDGDAEEIEAEPSASD